MIMPGQRHREASCGKAEAFSILLLPQPKRPQLLPFFLSSSVLILGPNCYVSPEYNVEKGTVETSSVTKVPSPGLNPAKANPTAP